MGQSTSNQILCFAHRGEAKAFLSELPFKPHKDLNSDLQGTYSLEDQGRKLTLIITGEGKERAMINLTKTLSFLRAKNPTDNYAVINLGVCGLLRVGEFQIGDAHLIRTVYSEASSQKMEFKSYSQNLFDSTDSIDCVTTQERILDDQRATQLSHFAPLVDKEAHAFAMVCDQLQTPFAAIKVISDEARGEICSQVKEEANIWSDTLLKKYHQLYPLTSLPSPQEEITIDGLHITVSQQRVLKNLLNACEKKGYSKEDAFKKAKLSLVLESEIRPKDRTKAFLENLSQILNPLNHSFKEKLNQIVSPLENAGFKVKFDQNFEDDTLHLSADLQSQKQINDYIQALEEFDYLKVKSLFSGEERF